MFVLGNFFQAMAAVLDKICWLYSLVIFLAVLISWVNPDPGNPIVRFLRSITEPLFSWIRQRIPVAIVGALDLSPVIALMGLWFLRMFVVATLVDLSLRLR